MQIVHGIKRNVIEMLDTKDKKSNNDLDILVDVMVTNSDTPTPTIPNSNKRSYQLNTGLVKTTSRNNSTQQIRTNKPTRVKVIQ